jgi:hypothetical protein
MGLEQAVGLLKDVVLAGAALVAAYVGLRGLGAWRRQLSGNTEYQLAKAMLASAYELRDAVAAFRNPFLQHASDPDLPADKLKDLSREEREWHAFAQAYQKRWEAVSKAKGRLDTNLFEAEAVWGPQIRNIVSLLNPLLGELLFAVQDRVEARKPGSHYDRADAEEQRKQHDTLYGGRSTDKFKNKLEDVISAIENELRPHIIQHHS